MVVVAGDPGRLVSRRFGLIFSLGLAFALVVRGSGRGRTTVARLIAEALAEAGVEWAFTVPGESFLGVLDALPRPASTSSPRAMRVAPSFMAEAVGQLTGKPAAVLGTRAVGAGNMAIGIHTARQNSTPIVALVGQVKREFLGREAFQEVDQVRVVRPAGQVGGPDRRSGNRGRDRLRRAASDALGGTAGPDPLRAARRRAGPAGAARRGRAGARRDARTAARARSDCGPRHRRSAHQCASGRRSSLATA